VALKLPHAEGMASQCHTVTHHI